MLHRRTCHLCEAMCGLKVEVVNGQVTGVKGDPQDPFSRGYHCIKGEALMDLQNDPKRLRRPIKRVGNDWQELSWDQALDEAALGLGKVRDKYGADAVAVYSGNPTVHNYGSLVSLPSLLRAIGSRNRFSATSVDQLPHHIAASLMFGHQLLLPIPDIDRTKFFLILGANPVISRGSLMTAPDIAERLKEVRARNGRVVVIDPRKTETAAMADEHLYIRPGTDALLLMAMINSIVSEFGPGRLRQLAPMVDGYTVLADVAKSFPPERVEKFTGIAGADIRRLAGEFAMADAAVAYGRVGASQQEFGSLTQWLVNALNVVTGNLDREGGAMFTTPALDPLPYTSTGRFGQRRSRVRSLPSFAGEFPVSTLIDEMETPGQGQIKAMLTVAGNPVLSTPSGPRLQEAMRRLEFMVAIDVYVNATTRHANIILPPTFGLEHEHYDVVFHLLAVRNFARYSAAAITPTGDVRHDWEIIKSLTSKLERRSQKNNFDIKGLLTKAATPARLLDLGLRFGSYGPPLRVIGAGASLAEISKLPYGMDFGPLKPRLPERLFTKNKRINLAPDLLVQDVTRLEKLCISTPKSELSLYDLKLIGRRLVRVNNSWMGHIERLTRGRSTCTVLMHHEDAAARGLTTGDLVRVESKSGSISIRLVTVNTIMPGVISIPHGYGHGLSPHAKSEDPEPSVNDITDHNFIDAFSGMAALCGVPVRVCKAEFSEANISG